MLKGAHIPNRMLVSSDSLAWKLMTGTQREDHRVQNNPQSKERQMSL